MKIILSTRNPSKVEQIKGVFEGSSILVLTLDQANIKGQGVEDGKTLEENALKKAMFVHQSEPTAWAMADDTGIFIDTLGGKPGVDTANWIGGNKDADQAALWILDQLKDATNRRATFKTVVAIVAPDGTHTLFWGEAQGALLDSPRSKAQPGMPYSLMFVPDGSDKVWAEMTVDEENNISHRGKAFKQAREFLEKLG